jgi:hypothetical protein
MTDALIVIRACVAKLRGAGTYCVIISWLEFATQDVLQDAAVFEVGDFLRGVDADFGGDTSLVTAVGW